MCHVNVLKRRYSYIKTSIPTSIVPEYQMPNHTQSPRMEVADGEFELLEKTNL